MFQLITLEDIIDIYQKGKQRGIQFILSKININSLSRTKSAFNDSAFENSNWWNIPKVKQRWNKLITGNPELTYEKYLVTNILNDKANLKLISIGSGSCSHEIELAKHSIFDEIVCIDISEYSLSQAKKNCN